MSREGRDGSPTAMYAGEPDFFDVCRAISSVDLVFKLFSDRACALNLLWGPGEAYFLLPLCFWVDTVAGEELDATFVQSEGVA
jgi:hypothetical protein